MAQLNPVYHQITLLSKNNPLIRNANIMKQISKSMHKIPCV